MTISRSQMPRQMYGLGSLVKSIGKTVKKIIKSPVAKVAMLGFGANALMPGGLTSLFSGGSGLTGILGKGKSILGGLTGAQKITGALSLGSVFAGMEDQQVEDLKRNPEALRSYLSQYYRNLNKNATDQEVNEFVESNMTEYKADGGRIGYREGNLAMGLGSGFTLKPPGELAYDATNTNIYGSSAASFTPKTITNQLGDQVQAGFGKTPGLNPNAPTLTGPNTQTRPFLNMSPSRPATLPGMRPGNIPGTDTPYSTLRGGPNLQQPQPNVPFMGKGGPEAFDNFGISNTMAPPTLTGVGEPQKNIEDPNNPGRLMSIDGRLPPMDPNQPTTTVPLPSPPRPDYVSNSTFPFRKMPAGSGIVTGGNLEEAYADAQKRAQETRAGGMFGQVVLPGEMTFENFSNSFNPSNPSGLIKAPLQKMPFAQQANSSSPIAQIAGMANGGRMGYNEGTPEMGMIDPNKAKQAKQMIGMGADQDLISTITGLTKEQIQFLMRENKAYGGRMGYQDGSPEENAVQASGIMDLPLNQNPAGITELDLRETGGFIPPVGVKEKADDIPAMLSNNEFVFTADAVRGMGDGNVNKGAQRMYDIMKKLEKGGRV